jgi:hypothetical protein
MIEDARKIHRIAERVRAVRAQYESVLSNGLFAAFEIDLACVRLRLKEIELILKYAEKALQHQACDELTREAEALGLYK